METKWTPGPWIFEAGVEDSKGEFFVCHPGTVCDATTVCNPTFEADAHLIAAAPALYEALTRALGVIVEMGNLNGFHTLTDGQLGRAVIEVARQCSDALALARGEHPAVEEA